jgi:hypothetical protein
VGAGASGAGAWGGGLYTADTTVVIENSTIGGNSAVGGSGIANGSGAGGNGGAGLGGGLFVSGGSATITGSTVAENSATGGSGASGTTTNGPGGGAEGAGLDVGGCSPCSTVTIEGSTFWGNAVNGGAAGGAGASSGSATGGGIFDGSKSNRLDVVNSTFFTNLATTVNGTSQTEAGGIYTYASGTLASDTLDGNVAYGSDSRGGNLDIIEGGSPYTIVRDTIIAAGGASFGNNCYGSGTDGGYNLEDDAGGQCGFSSANHSLVGVSPMLAVGLGANGGPTPTFALEPGSPAIGAGGACTDPTAGGAPLSVDQRGDARPATCDIGAFQSEPPVNTTAPSISGTAQPGDTLTCNDGNWTGDGAIATDGQVGALTFAVAWLRDGSAIGGANQSTYAVGSGDAGHSLSCQVTATGAYAQSSASSGSVSVPAPAPSSTGGGGSGSAPSVLTMTISGLAETAARFAEKHVRHSHLALGTTFSFTLSLAGEVKLVFTKAVAGRRVKARCTRLTKHNRHKPHCSLTATVATMTVAGVAGANKIKFNGTVQGKRLAPGHYTVTLTATSASTTPSTPASLSFTIIRR